LNSGPRKASALTTILFVKGAVAEVLLFISCEAYLGCEKGLCYVLGTFTFFFFSQYIYQQVTGGTPKILEQITLLILLDSSLIKTMPEFSCYLAKTGRHHLI